MYLPFSAFTFQCRQLQLGRGGTHVISEETDSSERQKPASTSTAHASHHGAGSTSLPARKEKRGNCCHLSYF